MIPYEELVVALQTWRAKQGLPVGQISGALTPPAVMAAPIAAPVPGSGPQRSGPPVAPPKSGSTGPQQAFGGTMTPPPLAASEDSLDVDEGALIEEAHFDAEGGEFEEQFAAASRASMDDGESTSIGSAPAPRASESTLDEVEPPPASNRSHNEDW